MTINMGMFKKPSVSIFEPKKLSVGSYTTKKRNSTNPNPTNFTIKKYEYDGAFLAIYINYPDCINFEGNKILVFSGASIEDLRKQKIIDPHFSDNKKYHSPIARFEPTHAGWVMALEFLRFLNE